LAEFKNTPPASVLLSMPPQIVMIPGREHLLDIVGPVLATLYV
jgi:hypothetical protein